MKPLIKGRKKLKQNSRKKSPNGFNIAGHEVIPDLNQVKDQYGKKRISPRAMEVLVHLYNKRGELVSKAELLHEYWRDRIGAEDSLTHSIREIRVALGDSGSEQRVIETIPKKGYRIRPETKKHHRDRRSVRALATAVFCSFAVIVAFQFLTTNSTEWNPASEELQIGPEAQALIHRLDVNKEIAHEYPFSPVVSQVAKDHLVWGIGILHSHSNSRFVDAAKMFAKSVQSDPDFALAWAWLGITQSLVKIFEVEVDDAYYWNLPAIANALHLDTNLAEAHTALALTQPSVKAALAEHQQAIKLDPANFYVLLYAGETARFNGHSELEMVWFEKAHNLRPHEIVPLLYLPNLYRNFGSNELEQQTWEKLAAVVNTKIQNSPQDSKLLTAGVFAFEAIGESKRADTWLNQLFTFHPENRIVAYNAACFYARRGENENALHHLEKLVELGWHDVQLLRTDEDLDSLRQSPQFHSILSQLDPEQNSITTREPPDVHWPRNHTSQTSSQSNLYSPL